MVIKNSGIIVLAILVVVIAGLAVAGVMDLAAETGSPTTDGSDDPARSETKSSGYETSYRTVTDMSGRLVAIPSDVSMVLCTSPPPTTFVYMLAPDKLGAWQSTPSDESARFIPAEYRNLTIVSWGSGTNYEAYIALQPDLVFIGCEGGISSSDSANLTQEKFGTIPVVCVDNARNATEYGPTLTFMGDVLGVPDVAAAENAYYQNVLEEVQATVAGIPEEERVRVYYAEGSNGLSTDLIGSPHSQLIDVCGGLNVAGEAVLGGSTSSSVTKESLLMWKPEAIITTSEEFFGLVYDEETWKQLPAVQNGRVYLTPRYPYNWFDRPPGVNRIVGIPWTAHILYPDLFPEEWFREKAKEFYSVFYHYELSDEELSWLLSE